MNGSVSSEATPAGRMVVAAVGGAVAGLLGTFLVLGSIEFGLFGAAAAGVVSTLTVLAQTEHAEG